MEEKNTGGKKKKPTTAFSLDHCIHETLGAMQEIGTKDIFNSPFTLKTCNVRIPADKPPEVSVALTPSL